MTKYETYEAIKQTILGLKGTVGNYQEINYGIQFDVTLEGFTSKVRVYESKKKGTTTDLSQVKHEVIRQAIEGGKVAQYKEVEGSAYKSDCFTQSLIGVDESGKGDYFGALVIAAVYADAAMKQQLIQLGVMDSKKLKDSQIAQLAQKIEALCPYEVLMLAPDTYNKVYHRIQNLNLLLAKGHSSVIHKLVTRTQAEVALSDQFGDKKLIEQELKVYGTPVLIEQRPKAESNVVVAAASIVARHAFVKALALQEEKYGQLFPKGAGEGTVQAGRQFVQHFGENQLMQVAKVHFKVTDKVTR